MTNWEKFKDILDTTSFSIDNTGNIGKCAGTPCTKCVFFSAYDGGLGCGKNKVSWLKAEYNDYEELRAKTLRAFQSTLNWGCLCHEVDSCGKCAMTDFRRIFKIPSDVNCNIIVKEIISEGFKYFEDCVKRSDDV